MKKLLFLSLISFTTLAWADSDPLKLDIKMIMPQQDYQVFSNNLDTIMTRMETESAQQKLAQNKSDKSAYTFAMCVRAQQLEKIFASNQHHRKQYNQENGNGAFDFAASNWRDLVAKTRNQCDAAQAAARQ